MSFAIIVVVCVILACMLGIFVGVPIYDLSDGYVMRVIFISIVVLLAINVFFALFVKLAIPKKWINPFSKFFKVHNWEQKLYVALDIRKWKDKIPELGKTLENFDKSKVHDPHNNEYVMKFMCATINGELMHALSAIFGVLVIFIDLQLFFVVGLPLLICNTIINVLPVMVQRYNRPKLILLYKRNERENLTKK